MDLGTYMTRFQWDMAKYPIQQSLKNIADIIAKVCVCMVPENRLLHGFKIVENVSCNKLYSGVYSNGIGREQSSFCQETNYEVYQCYMTTKPHENHAFVQQKFCFCMEWVL